MTSRLHALIASLLLPLLLLTVASHAQADPARVKVLFLGDKGHHKPADRFAQLAPVLKQRGIDLTYTEQMSDLKPETLGAYDGLMIYSNETRLSPDQEKAMLD